MTVRDEVEAQLTGPGGMFEITREVVDGVELKVFKDRLGSLREVHQLGTALHGPKEYLVHGERRVTFQDLAAQACSVAAVLAERGVAHGDRVAVLSANNPAWVQAFWGTVDLGAILVGLNGWWKAEEIVYGLQDSGSKVLVADRGRFVRIADQLDACPDLEAVYLVDADPAELGGDPRLHRFDELLQRLDAPWPDAPIAEADPAVIFYTSGTTGKPKGAISTQRSMIANLQNTVYGSMVAAGVAARRAEPGSTAADPPASSPAALLTSPLFHVSGCHSGIVVAMLAGIKDVIPVGKFEPDKAMELIQAEKVTIWATVPTMVWRVVEDPRADGYDLSSVTTVAYGGSPVASELARRVAKVFPNVSASSQANAYGLTESSSVAVVNSGEDYARKPDSVGRPVPVVDLRVVRADGADAGVGEVGEVWIKGPIIMPGYWGKPEATAEAITDGWLHSGDVGYLDEEGFLFITDRAKDMLIRGGENVYCAEIENRLAEHPAIAEAAIIGVSHPTLGEEVKAVVRLEPGQVLTAAEVQAWVSEALADFKVPTYVELTTDYLPRNASGKLLKNVLRGTGEVSFAETM